MRLTGFHVPIDRLSFSALATFMTCPEQFRLERVKKQRSKRGLSGFVGSVQHGAIERLLATKMVDPVFTPQGGDLTAAYESSFRDAFEEEEPEWEIAPDKVTANGLLMLGSFVDTLWDSLRPVDVETRVEETIRGVPVPIVGKIDCYEEELTREWKTAKQKVSEPKAKWRMQAQIYQLFTGLPVEWAVSTRQVTPITWTPQSVTAEKLRLEVGNKDATARLVVQAVELMNDMYARYGPDETWPLHGLLHQYACRYCLAGPLNPSPSCPAWQEQKEEAA